MSKHKDFSEEPQDGETQSNAFDYDDLLGTTDVGYVPKITEELVGNELSAQLVVLMGATVGRKQAVEDELIIGRHPSADFEISEGDVSRHHARIRLLDDGTYVIEDLGSRNGTLVNGHSAKEQEIGFGDLIRIGANTVLLFTHSDNAQRRLLHLQKMEMVGELAGGVAHEFNNLLAVVVNNLSYIERLSTLDEREGRACIREAKTAALRGGEIARQLIDFSRPGQQDKSPIDISSLAKQMASFAKRTFPPQVQVVYDIEPNIAVNGSWSQLYQVLLNLGLNAKDAMPDGGELRLSVRVERLLPEQAATLAGLKGGDYAVLSVVDSGTGMTPEVQERVFDPFFTTKGLGEGTGLGLSMAFGTIKNHGGVIKVNSAEGSGSSFDIYLPLCRAGSIVKPSSTIEIPPQVVGRILVVDDDAMVLSSTSRLLRTLGHEVFYASDGAEACSMFEEMRGQIELVLLDMLMPVMGGMETFKKLMDIDPGARVLLTSGHCDEAGVNELIADGALGFLPKPLNPEDLQLAISLILTGRRLPDRPFLTAGR